MVTFKLGLSGWVRVDEAGLAQAAAPCSCGCLGPGRRPGLAGQVGQPRVGPPGLRPVGLFHKGM